MRVDKENQFSSFSKLLTKIDATNLGQYEIKVLKQQHDYLDRLRQQRMKIQELKRKYDDCENQLTLQRENSSHISMILQQKCQEVEALQSELESQRLKRESVQKRMEKSLESDKLKTKTKLKQIQHENQQLKKLLRQKELIIISMQEQHSQKLKKCKESFQAEKRSLLIELDQKVSEIKSKNTQNELNELKNLVTRQNKALRAQDQKYQQIFELNQNMFAELEQLRSDYKTKCEECRQYEERINQMYEELENVQGRLEKQDYNNRMKGQLEQIRRKMTDMQKGQIERIQFIVNELE